MVSPSAKSVLHGWRSRAIDAFALAEANIERLLRKQNLTASGELLGSKLEKLRKAKPSATLSDARKKQIDGILAQLRTLIGLRNDLVHAQMIVRQDGEQIVGCFANPNQQCEFSSVTREISGPRLQALGGKVAKLAKDLEAA